VSLDTSWLDSEQYDVYGAFGARCVRFGKDSAILLVADMIMHISWQGVGGATTNVQHHIRQYTVYKQRGMSLSFRRGIHCLPRISCGIFEQLT